MWVGGRASGPRSIALNRKNIVRVSQRDGGDPWVVVETAGVQLLLIDQFLLIAGYPLGIEDIGQVAAVEVITVLIKSPADIFYRFRQADIVGAA
jgi:hypothetical protein